MLSIHIAENTVEARQPWSPYNAFRKNGVRKNSFDCIVVPGAGADSAGNPSPWGADMLDLATYAYWHGFAGQIITMGGLSPGDPGPLGYADAGKKYLFESQQLIPEEDIITLDFARDTIGDIFSLARTIKDGEIEEIENATRFLIVCPDYQAERIRVIAEHLFGLLAQENNRNYSIVILPITNPYLDEAILAVRRSKEAERIDGYQDSWVKYSSLDDFGIELRRFHGAYNGQADEAMAGKTLPADLKPNADLRVLNGRHGLELAA